MLQCLDFRFFYDPYDAADPVRHPGQLHVGYRTDDQTFYGYYGMLNTEAHIARYLGIARGQLPPEHYYTTGCSGPCPRTWGRNSSRPAVRPATTTGSRSSRALITSPFNMDTQPTP